MATIELAADIRQERGKKTRFLRRRGLTPANLYGPKIESIALQIQTSHLQQALVQGDPPIYIGSGPGERELWVAPVELQEGEEDIVAHRLVEALTSR